MQPIDKELDNLWSQLVKLKAGNKCEKCRRTQNLNSHHLYSRSNRAVRHDPENGCCLCSGCHALNNDSAHKAPADFWEWIRKKRGETWYQMLRIRANTVTKHDKKLLKIYLQQELKKYD
jgi:hypothetical protein